MTANLEKTMKKRIITIDIETLPTEEPFESKLFWQTEEEYSKTALDASLGRILCIGYCEENETGEKIEQGVFGWREETKDFEPDESLILADFWQYIRGFQKGIDLIIGHNILGFDLPFIIQRSVINSVRPTVNFDLYKFQKSPIFDTMLRWDFYKYGNSTSLKKLAYAFGLNCPKSGDIDGSNIHQAFQQKRLKEIRQYCLRDVETTHKIWQKMTFRDQAKPEVQHKDLALAA